MSKFKFPVKSEKQIQEERLYPEGEFKATVINAEFKTTRNNDPMVLLQLKFIDNDGRERVIFCGILLNDNWAYLHRHFWESAGCIEKYEDGELYSSDYINKNVIIKIKHQLDKNTDEMRSNVVDFLSKISDTSVIHNATHPSATNVVDSIYKEAKKQVIIEDDSFPDDQIPF